MNRKGRATEVAPFTRSAAWVYSRVWFARDAFTHTHTRNQVLCVVRPARGEQLCFGACVLGGSCCILWPYHRTQHLTQTDRFTQREAAARCHSKRPRANCTHPHRSRCLKRDTSEPATIGACLCATSPQQRVSVTALPTSRSPSKGKRLNYDCCLAQIFTYPLPNPSTSHKPRHQKNPVPPPVLAACRQLSPPWSSEAIWDLREKPFIQDFLYRLGWANVSCQQNTINAANGIFSACQRWQTNFSERATHGV